VDLRPTAGHHVQVDPRERAVDLVRQLLEIYSSEELEDDEDVDEKINENHKELSRLLPDPAFNDLIRWPRRHPKLAHLDPEELTPEKIVDVAMDYRPSVWRGFTADHVRAALAAGGDPNQRSGAIRETPLHAVLSAALWTPAEQDSSVEAVELLIGAGADVEAVNESGETPLWLAVRRGRRDHTVALLDAGADPWRTVLGGRSAGRVALDGPLAPIFEQLPGAPTVSDEERAAQARADELITFYEQWRHLPDGLCVAFVSGVDEDGVIRRLGLDPAEWPSMVDAHEDGTAGQIDYDPDQTVLWVGRTEGGGVVVYDWWGVAPVSDFFCRAVSAEGGEVASTFNNPAGGELHVNWWRDGARIAWPDPGRDPSPNDPPEAWLCRFGDHSHESFYMYRNLALMTMLTGVRVDLPRWLDEGPKRLVRPDLR
jgi:ankyrin repeat protein